MSTPAATMGGVDADEIVQAADALSRAQQTRTPIAPLTATYGAISVDDAYQIQMANIAKSVAQGAKIKGHKVGLSARAMQRMLGVDEPDYGHLLDSLFAFENSELPLDRLLQPRVEIEVAFVLKARLEGPGVTVADVIRATDFILPAVEIVDSRIADWKITLADTVADNASSGMVVLGGSPSRLNDVDIRLIGACLQCNGRVREVGASGAVLGNPVVAVAWLANKVAAYGVALEPGHVIMPGSCTRMIPIGPGDSVRAEFDRLGHVTVSFCSDRDL
jgi:2-keto-4-pentenoate hydratase